MDRGSAVDLLHCWTHRTPDHAQAHGHWHRVLPSSRRRHEQPAERIFSTKDTIESRSAFVQPCSRPYRGYQHAFSPSKNSASSHEEAAESALHERPRSQRERPSKCLFLRSVCCFRPCRGYHHAIPRPVRIGHGSVAGQSGQRMLEGETFYLSSTE
jgi:hypothetical protein